MDFSSVSGFIPTIAIALTLSKGNYSTIQELEWATPLYCKNKKG
ncbi:MAG: hypothetical protein V7K41_29765 [Nostoc sp.]